MYIGADDPVLRIGGFVFTVVYPASIVTHIRVMREFDTEPTGSRRIFFPCCRGIPACFIIFELDTVKEFIPLISILYIVTGSAHFKKDDLKRSNKNIVALYITPAGFIHDGKSFIAILYD